MMFVSNNFMFETNKNSFEINPKWFVSNLFCCFSSRALHYGQYKTEQQRNKVMKWIEKTLWVIRFFLIILLVYTSVSKLSNIELFEAQLSRQPDPIGALSAPFAWLLPLTELNIACILMCNGIIREGLILAFVLMLAFTGYVALAVIGYWEDIPCSCGGVLSQLGWRDHLWFNLFFLVIAALGIAAERHLRRSKHQGGNLQQAAPAGGPA